MPAAVEGLENATGPHVTAVLVSHDGARWLTQVLDALERQRRMPDALVAVDTGSTDGSADLLADRMGPDSVCRVDRSTGFGAAVHAGLERVGARRVGSPRHVNAPAANPTDRSRSWIWLLHDDSAPDPEALAALLAQVRDDVAVVGPKLREWPSLRRLLEVGVTISGTGQRETGLERGEPDQGQHDRPRDVLAVNTAGMLVRRDVWDQLGGLDPRLPLFGDDLDFGWRVARAGYRTRTAPDAVVFHLEAATRGLRSSGAYSGRPVAQRRRAALFTLLANAGRLGFWWQSVRLLVGSILRMLGLLLAKAPGEAFDELRGLAGVYGHPFAMLRARRQRHRQAARSARQVRHLLPSPLLPYRHGVDTVLDVGFVLFRSFGAGGQPQVSGKRAVVETGPVPSEADELPSAGGTVSRMLRRPWVVVAAVLVLCSLWSARGLFGEGQLAGGALLPAPDSVGAWWSLIWDSWHPVGAGSDQMAAPYVWLLTAAGTLTFGQPWLLVDLLVLAAVPLAALTASRLARRLFESQLVRLWWSVTYASLPVATGAMAQGRIGTLVGILVLPLVGSAVLTLVGGARPVWLRALRLALGVTVLVAFVPVAYVIVVIGLVGAALVWSISGLDRTRSLLTVAAVAAVPWALLGRWMWERAVDPVAWWWEAGLVDARVGTVPIDLEPSALEIVGGVAGGPHESLAWVGLIVVAAGVIALGRTDRLRAIGMAWGLALVGLGLAVLGAGQRIDVGVGSEAASVWVGFPLACWLAALATAAGLAADGVGSFLTSQTFGWRQPVTVGASVVALTVPVLSAGWWVWSDDGVLDRENPTPVPAYLASRASGATQSATLVISGSTDTGVGYQIVRDDGTRLGEESVLAPRSQLATLDRAVADLLSYPDVDAVDAMLDHGIGAVYALPPVDVSVESTLDGGTGLARAGTTDPQARAWELDAPSGALRVVPADGEAKVVEGPVSLTGQVDLPDGSPSRQLRLAADASDRWSAAGSGGALETRETPSGTQAFQAPNDGEVTLSYASDNRRWALLHLGAGLIAVVLALPGKRRRS